jgi:hypothetical protein
MFQYAFIKSMSIKHGRNFIIPPKKIFGKHYYLQLRSCIDDCFELNCERGLSDFPTLQESHFHFDSKIYENPFSENVDFLGYFQTEKYFKNVEKEIREGFTFKEEIYSPTKEQFDSIIGNGSAISLHIRRTDYTTNPNHPTQSIEYYHQALNELDHNLSVIIMSDDPEWCKTQEIFSGDRFLISEGGNCYVDLCLMTLCDYHIIANSSFSWWGSWLAKSKKVIAPKNWFGGSSINYNTEDLYYSDTIIL